MSTGKRIVVIGGDPEGLAAAFYLARAGLKPVVLERRSVLGGPLAAEEFHPGYKASTTHVTGLLRSEVARDMQLNGNQLQLLKPDTRLCVLGHEGPPLLLHDDSLRTARELSSRSSRDSQSYITFHGILRQIGEIFLELAGMTPPSLEKPSPQDFFRLFKTARMARRMDKRDFYRLLRWVSMPVSDLAEEWFEGEGLKSAIAGRGIFGAALGPRSAGSALLLLARSADDPHPAGPASSFAGGANTLIEAMASAAKNAGAEIRLETDVLRVESNRSGVSAVHLSDGQEIAAEAVVSSVDPRRTLLDMVNVMYLGPEFVRRLRNYRCSGVVARVNLALDALPEVPALAGDGEQALAGRIQIGGSVDYLERAFDACKYGEFSREPYLEVRIPTLLDPSLAPAGKHVMSVHAQFAPYDLRGGWSPDRSRELGEIVMQTLYRHIPGLESSVLQRQVLSPRDIETRFGLTGGHLHQGELTLDQLFTMRPLLGWARYRTPISGLYLCGRGTHPGWGVMGASGANAAREVLKDFR